MLNLDATEDDSPTLFFSRLSVWPDPAAESANSIPEDIQALERRAYVALGSGDLDAAEQHFREALGLRQRATGAARQGLPQAFGRLGLVAIHRGHGEQARTLFELGLELARALRSRLQPGDAMLLQNLGLLARRRGELDEAGRCYLGALSIKVAALGWSHPTVATTLTGQGYLALLRRRAADALASFERAQLILERSEGACSAELAHVFMGSGRAHLHLEQPIAAEGAFAAALTIREQLLAPVAQISRSRFALACARWQRAPASARALAEQAIREYQRSHRPQLQLLHRMRDWLAHHPSLAA